MLLRGQAIKPAEEAVKVTRPFCLFSMILLMKWWVILRAQVALQS